MLYNCLYLYSKERPPAFFSSPTLTLFYLIPLSLFTDFAMDFDNHFQQLVINNAMCSFVTTCTYRT